MRREITQEELDHLEPLKRSFVKCLIETGEWKLIEERKKPVKISR
jgi:hypothetical protein